LQTASFGLASPPAPAATSGVTASVVRSTSTASFEAQPATVSAPLGAIASAHGSWTPEPAGSTTQSNTQLPPEFRYSRTRSGPVSAISKRVADRNARSVGCVSPVPITVVPGPPAAGNRTTRLPSVSTANTSLPFTATSANSALVVEPSVVTVPPA